MELDLDGLRDTIVGEFLKCAMMADVSNITSYNQSSLDLKVTLDGNEVELRKLYSLFEERLGHWDALSEKREELVRMAERSLVAINDFSASVNTEKRLFISDLTWDDKNIQYAE